MSGICGIVNLTGEASAQQAIISSMAGSMLSVSGEDSKTIIDGTAGLGVNFRDIQDHFFDDKDISVIATGEIFEPTGTHVAGTIARLYRQYKERCVEHLNGQFNFCVWDKKEKKLTAATDHFGTSALYYYYDGEHLIFASKIRAILKASLFQPSIDKNAIYNYSVYCFVPTPQTIYLQIKKLPPGHIITLCNGKFSIYKYWDISYVDGKNKGEDYYCAKIRQELEGAVKRRFSSLKDTDHVGAFLSGGLDSSTVCGLMRKISGKETKAFSICFDEEKYNELRYIDMAVKHFGLKSYKYVIRPKELLGAIKSLVKEYDEPFGNPSAIAAYFCMKMAKDNGVDVLLGGDGGDENFGGYDRYVTDKVYSLYQYLPRSLRKYLIKPFVCGSVFKNIPAIKKIGNYIGHSNLQNPERFMFYELYSMYKRSEIFSEYFLKSVDVKGPLDVCSNIYSKPDTGYVLNRLMYLDSKTVLIDNDLRGKIDKVAQALGVGVRYPMLDIKLWGLGAEIPSYLKVKGLTRKYIYKKAFSDFLPRGIILKNKHGFGLPFAVWLRENSGVRKFAEDILLDPSAQTRGYFRKGFFEGMFRMHDNEKTAYYGDRLWVFLMLEVWHREWVGK